MGVDRTDYLMLAADMGTKDFDFDKHEAEICGEPGAKFDIVYDGMSGKYCLAGKIIAKSDPYDGFEMAKIDPDARKTERCCPSTPLALFASSSTIRRLVAIEVSENLMRFGSTLIQAGSNPSNRHRERDVSEIRYRLRYPGSFLEGASYTFPQLCHFMRIIPIAASLEVLLLSGEVHFTLPARPRS